MAKGLRVSQDFRHHCRLGRLRKPKVQKARARHLGPIQQGQLVELTKGLGELLGNGRGRQAKWLGQPQGNTRRQVAMVGLLGSLQACRNIGQTYRRCKSFGLGHCVNGHEESFSDVVALVGEHAEGWEWRSKNLARLAGIEPATLGFGGQYSIH
ncbi:MAG: hypothetical protein RL483_1258 [Pseudomonadota bacterium]